MNNSFIPVIFKDKLTNIINDFLKEFGGLSIDTLNKLNRQLSAAYKAGETEVVVGTDPDFATNHKDNNDNNDNNDGNNKNNEHNDTTTGYASLYKLN